VTPLLGLLGLGRRAGHLVIGVDAVRTALQADRCHLVVVSGDAGPRAEEKVVRLARGKGLPVVVGPVAEELGRALGRPPVQAVGVRDRALARGVLGAGLTGQ